MLDKAIETAHANRERYLNQLIELLRIPSISTLSEHKPDMERAAGWLAADMAKAGLNNVQVMPTGGNPVVYGEWLEAGPSAPTVLIYGHYDVQPVDPLDLWDSPPFEPEVRDGKLYARGASDDKGQAFVHVKAVETILKADGKLPINVKMILEGEEEVGSPNLEPFVLAHTDLLAADSGLVSDGRVVSSEQPSIVYALRGLTYMEIRVRGPKRDLHSGSYGGSVHNPAQVVAEVIAALHDENGTITIPGFYDYVLALSDDERAALKKRSLRADGVAGGDRAQEGVGREGVHATGAHLGAAHLRGQWDVGRLSGRGRQDDHPGGGGRQDQHAAGPQPGPRSHREAVH